MAEQKEHVPWLIFHILELSDSCLRQFSLLSARNGFTRNILRLSWGVYFHQSFQDKSVNDRQLVASLFYSAIQFFVMNKGIDTKIAQHAFHESNLNRANLNM